MTSTEKGYDTWMHVPHRATLEFRVQVHHQSVLVHIIVLCTKISVHVIESCFNASQACNDAHILLSTHGELRHDFVDTYEVVIGGNANTKVFIRKNSEFESQKSAVVPHLVSQPFTTNTKP